MAGDINIGNVSDGVAKIVGLFKKNPAMAAQMEDKEAERELQRDLQQILLNMAETAQGLFKGGWRPFVGWVCGFAFAYNFVLQPFLIFVFTMAGYGAEVAQLPELQMFEIMGVLGGMLGLSINRSGDKRAGVNKA
jgi:holin (3TMs family)